MSEAAATIAFHHDSLVMERLTDLTLPVALVIGDGDRAFSVPTTTSSASSRTPTAPRSRDARHFVMRSHPESVADAVATVIAELGAELSAPAPCRSPSTALAELHAALDHQRLVILQAPPGTGKTTRVPPSLIEQPWVGERKVLMLEPRRVAARAAATRMAEERGEQVGDTIGLRTRNDTRVSAITRVEVVTEGVLTRMLLDDPALEGYAVVLFDEFHERSIHTDTALAFLRETVGALRPDLRIVVMSATLDAEALAARLRTDAVVKVEAERHPVTISYRPPEPGKDLTDAAAAAVVDAVGSDAHAGDLLVFLPGVGAITRVERSVRRTLGSRLDGELVVMPLHGSLRGDDQDAALRRDPRPSQDRAGNPLAETSVTIDGVATVIDTGQRRRPEIDHGRGMGVLRTVTPAEQRPTSEPGVPVGNSPAPASACGMPPTMPTVQPTSPEITTADLSSLALDVAAWGATDIHELPWLDAPPAPALGQARALLADLELLDAKYRLTDHGRHAHRLGADPRLAHLLTRSVELEAAYPGAVATACLLAAALADRDLLRGRRRPVDLRLRLDALLGTRRDDADPQALRLARDSARRWERRLGASDTAAADLDLAGLLTSVAFPDRIARRRDDGGSFLLASGAGVAIDPTTDRSSSVAGGRRNRGGRCRRADPHGGSVATRRPRGCPRRPHRPARRGWLGPQARDVALERQRRLGSLILQRRPETSPDEAAVAAALVRPSTRRARAAAMGRLGSPVSRAVGIRPRPRPGDLAGRWGRRPACHGRLVAAARLDRTSRRKDLESMAGTTCSPACSTGARARTRSDRADPLGGSVWQSPPDRLLVRGRSGACRSAPRTLRTHRVPAVLGGRVPLTLHLLSPAPPTRPGDPGSRVVLGGGLCGGPSGVARPLSEASLARGSAHGDPDQPGETALLTVDHTVGAQRGDLVRAPSGCEQDLVGVGPGHDGDRPVSSPGVRESRGSRRVRCRRRRCRGRDGGRTHGPRRRSAPVPRSSRWSRRRLPTRRGFGLRARKRSVRGVQAIAPGRTAQAGRRR